MIGYVIFGIVVIVILSGIRIIRPTERGAVETLGKYTSFRESGFNWIVPFFQSMRLVNVTERMQDIEPREIITKENLNAKADLIIYYKVRADEESIKKALYNVNDFKSQIVSLAQTTARNVIGGMLFKDVNSERDKLNISLAKILTKQTDSWGIDIVRVEMKEITPPESVQQTMNNIIKAQNTKDAATDYATAAETEADGKRRSAIKEAEGIKQARILVAEGEASRIKLVNEAAEKYFKGKAQLLRKLEVTENSLKNNAKIILTEKGINPQLLIGNLGIDKESKD